MRRYIKIGILAVVAVVLVVGFYFAISHRKTEPVEEQVVVTELLLLLK